MNTERTVLLVEDENPLAFAIKDLLEKSGFDVVAARSVDQAIGYLEDVPEIEVVWLDHYLLGAKNGLDFLAHVKQYDDKKDIPVFVVTNTGGHDKKSTYMKLGAIKYYVKVDSRLPEIVADVKNELARINDGK